ncbi:MAG: glycosyltransferase [Pseudomonadota bacterium]
MRLTHGPHSKKLETISPQRDNEGGVSLRILAVSYVWQGANDYAFIRAFRRAGHSVHVVSERDYVPSWRGLGLRALNRALRPLTVRDYNRALLERASSFQPDLLFVFKGAYLFEETIRRIQDDGAIAIQFYPDVSFHTHGPYLPRALKAYDWVFTTKTFGLSDMAEQLDVRDASFLPHAYDPETHRPLPLSDRDHCQYGCDASFIGDWSPKKQAILEQVISIDPSIDMSIFGSERWKNRGLTAGIFTGHRIYGDEYAKAIAASRINIGLLSEIQKGASRGDQITARTFEIPAAGGFMLHERTDEAMEYFEDGKECVFFDGPGDLATKIRYYLSHPRERKIIAAAGRTRCLTSGYAVDDRVRSVLERYNVLRATKSCGPSHV